MDEITAILDEAWSCHLACTLETGPAIIPMAYARQGDWLYLHGASSNRMLAAVVGRPVCVAITLVDGLVLARTASHHSVNYRSVILYGVGEDVVDLSQKREAMKTLVEHLVPGRYMEAREPTDGELEATRVVRLPIREASAKVRSGPPIDSGDDLELWAGVIPLRTVPGAPIPDPTIAPELNLPPSVMAFMKESRKR